MNIAITPTSGYARGTKFTLTVTGVTTGQYKRPFLIRCDMGDGNIKESLYRQQKATITHIYKYSGTYIVKIHAYSEEDTTSTTVATETITVNEFYKNKIEIIPSKATLSVEGTTISTPTTFTINVTSTDTNSPIYVTVNPKNSESIPRYSIPDKWSFLVKTWSINKKGTTIPLSFPYVVNKSNCKIAPGQNVNVPLAVSGTFTFDYVDDSSSATKLTLYTSLSTTEFSTNIDSGKVDFPSYSNPIKNLPKVKITPKPNPRGAFDIGVIKDVTTGGKTIKLDVDDPNFAKIKTGDTVTGTGIAANTAITAIQSNSSVLTTYGDTTLSLALTASILVPGLTQDEFNFPIKSVTPTRLKVTENYLNDIYPLKWLNIPIPVMVTLTDNNGKIKILTHPDDQTDNTAITFTLLDEADKSYSASGNFTVDAQTNFFDDIKPGYVFTTIKITNKSLLDKTLRIKAQSTFYDKTAKKINPIEGISGEFKLQNIDSSYEIAKINEDFNYANYFKSLMLPQHLQGTTEEFTKFIAACTTAKENDLNTEGLGNIVYEKIANFVSNHSDFETAEISKLKALAFQMGVEANVPNLDYPREIERLVNILSIPKHRLTGVIKEEIDFQQFGDRLSPFSVIIAKQQYWAVNKATNVKKLLDVGPYILNQNDPAALKYNTYDVRLLTVAGVTNFLADYELYYAQLYTPLNLEEITNSDDLIDGEIYYLGARNKLSATEPAYQVIPFFNDANEYANTSLRVPFFSPFIKNFVDPKVNITTPAGKTFDIKVLKNSEVSSSLLFFDTADPNFVNIVKDSVVKLDEHIPPGATVTEITKDSNYGIVKINKSLTKPIITIPYTFYKIKRNNTSYLNSMVDWNSSNTTGIEQSQSSFEDWHGEDKFVELLFNNILTKRLLG